MDTRLDKVTRMLALSFKKVYSLVLANESLYIIRTGNVGALEHYQFSAVGGAKAALAVSIAGAITNAFVKELEAGEARLASTPLPQLAAEKDNAVVSRAEVQSVAVREVQSPLMTSAGKALEMKLKTSKGDFTFVFTHTLPEQVHALEQALQKGKPG